MRAMSLHPGVTHEAVKSATGFRLEESDEVTVTAAPTSEELRILRDEVDPAGYVLRRAG